jgi:hypothetical protein
LLGPQKIYIKSGNFLDRKTLKWGYTVGDCYWFLQRGDETKENITLGVLSFETKHCISLSICIFS